ncbi:hypothetical protein [Sphingobacterium sp.]|uniref:hypothetical protein n=1 Tax=Sphingobacterium sp. TaxID=341027 RepID=UPI0028A877A6|nr:hypothetical protein [Sphingobacterium sp.]
MKKIVIIVASIIFILFILNFYIFYGKTDLFKFPFNSEVWGNASDWVLVIGTILSLLLIFRTIEIQLISNNYQKKLADIEIFKHIESIKPIIELKGTPPKYPSQVSGIINTNYWLILIENELSDLTLTAIFSTQSEQKYITSEKSIFFKGEKINIACDVFINTNHFSDYSFSIEIILNYRDKDKNQYRHIIKMTKPRPNIQSENFHQQTLIKFN